MAIRSSVPRCDVITDREVRRFCRVVYRCYQKHGRDLPWRKRRNAYRILVSEIMLQQTQVDRVIEKYKSFIKVFPDFLSLAQASLSDVLKIWQGLGYNRRAVALHRIARLVMQEFCGKLPATREELLRLPGIGEYTASAVLVFAFNRPEICIETNIRSVFIHFFFQGRNDVRDAEILPLVKRSLNAEHPREWYYALMDYGVMLKKQIQNPARRSAHYKRQSPFKGSNREVRGMILRTLIGSGSMTERMLVRELDAEPGVIARNVIQLQREGLLKRRGRKITTA